jgi:hypothetical protein
VHHHELVSLAPVGDSARVHLEAWVENKIIRFWPSFQKVRTGVRHLTRLTIIQSRIHNVSKDPNVYIYSGAQIQQTARAILLLVIILLLLAPVVICNIVSSAWGRIVVVMASTMLSLFILSGLTKSKAIELIVIGAT